MGASRRLSIAYDILYFQSVQDIYDIAEEIISGEDGESGKKKMW